MQSYDFEAHQPTLRVTTTPNDANQKGDIFGGWLMSQMDRAGAIVARQRARCLVSTVAVKELLFLKPIFVYDVVSFYPEVVKVGRTSVTVMIHVFAQRYLAPDAAPEKVGEATFVYVAIESPGVKCHIASSD